MATRNPLVTILGTTQELPSGDTVAGQTWTTVKKTADQTKQTDSNLANDSALQFSMLANTKYAIHIVVFFDTAANPDFKFALSGPTSPTLVRVLRQHIDPNALTTIITASETSYTASTAVAGGTGTNGGYIEMHIIVQNGANAGTFAFQWAQNTSNGSATIVRAGSYLEYMTL
jgi:hypothetical protein